MGEVQVVLFRRAGCVDRAGQRWQVADNKVVVTDAGAKARGARGDVDAYVFNAEELRELYVDMLGLLRSNEATPFFRDPVRVVCACPDVISASSRLGETDRRAMLRFVYSYMLSVEPAYFSRLLHHFVDSSREFFEFVERNSLNPWPVSEYADELGISMRKLNMLFYEKCGVSAKHWLLEQRLSKARELLLATDKKITDVAQECGFGSHAHFSESFKRRFKDCPRKFRQKSNPNSDAIEDQI